MTTQLRMVRLMVRLSNLSRYAGDRGWMARRHRDGREADASFDPGRALHHILDEAFGPSELKPFRLMAPRNRDRGTVYAYTRRTTDELLARVAQTAPPELMSSRILDLDQLDTKSMPAVWASNTRLGFDLRIRPVVRIRSELPNPRPGERAYAPGSEVDAFVAEAQRKFPDGRPHILGGTPVPSGMIAAGRDRPAVYRDWLSARMAGAASIIVDRTQMIAFERSRVSRGRASLEGPDATFHGELHVTDSDAFCSLLARGIGRHLSFGFGMLLLRPPRGE